MDQSGVTCGGTGLDNGSWYEYTPDNTPGQYPNDPWYNQWFYDDPLVQGGKRAKIKLFWDPAAFANFEITINWSTELWPDESTPPIPGMYPGPIAGQLDPFTRASRVSTRLIFLAKSLMISRWPTRKISDFQIPVSSFCPPCVRTERMRAKVSDIAHDA